MYRNPKDSNADGMRSECLSSSSSPVLLPEGPDDLRALHGLAEVEVDGRLGGRLETLDLPAGFPGVGMEKRGFNYARCFCGDVN